MTALRRCPALPPAPVCSGAPTAAVRSEVSVSADTGTPTAFSEARLSEVPKMCKTVLSAFLL